LLVCVGLCANISLIFAVNLLHNGKKGSQDLPSSTEFLFERRQFRECINTLSFSFCKLFKSHYISISIYINCSTQRISFTKNIFPAIFILPRETSSSLECLQFIRRLHTRSVLYFDFDKNIPPDLSCCWEPHAKTRSVCPLKKFKAVYSPARQHTFYLR
jgi:hypothetical protein